MSAAPAPSWRLSLRTAEATAALGAALAQALAGRLGLLVFLRGELGAGKTTLARGWLQALGVAGPVRSPTYTLVEPYETRCGKALHLDLYRLASADEIEQLGLADTPPERSLWLLEWPERAANRLPSPDLEIQLEGSGDSRLARLRAHADIEQQVRTALAGLESMDCTVDDPVPC